MRASEKVREKERKGEKEKKKGGGGRKKRIGNKRTTVGPEKWRHKARDEKGIKRNSVCFVLFFVFSYSGDLSIPF